MTETTRIAAPSRKRGPVVPASPAGRRARVPGRDRIQKSIDSGRARLVMSIIEERDEEILAIVRCIEDRLAGLCNAGGESPDDAPLTEWHLARQLMHRLESIEHQQLISLMLGVNHE